MDFRLRGFDMESHCSQVFPRSSLSSSSNFVNSSAHVTKIIDGGGTFRGCLVSDIHREIDKERIREEIIAAEIERRRVLEAEVRRELMIESEMMALQIGAGFPSSFNLETPLLTHYHDHRFKPEIPHGDWFIPDERRVATPFPDKHDRGGSHTTEIGGFEAVAFRQRPPSPKIKKVASNRTKDGKAIIGLGKPSGATLSGSKREAEVSPSSSAIRRSNGDSSSTSNIKKKKEEWKCMVCDISATSERHLNEHLSGKKHHAQMEALKPCCNNGVSEIKEQPSDLKELDKKIAGEGTRKKLRFWCSMCQVVAPDDKSMNKHTKGKKHLKNLLKKARGDTKLT